MRIKKIEVLGFKSFCDRAVLNFGEPIVGVVGPNGCGKSNIVDAIRWCMGEQSAKNLRGQAMGDVIFAGSDTRGPAGMAEVSLTFEDVGFSHETLEAALDNEGAMNGLVLDEEEPSARNRGDAEAIAVNEGDLSAGVDDGVEAEKALMAKLMARESPPTPAEALTKSDAGSSDSASVTALPVLSHNGDNEAEIDAYQATREAAAVLADRPPVIEYAKYSEVTITRRLFKDGTSSYFLNKVPCRLRDVTDFFLGSGVGTKAYSIIEQGRIGMIVSARAGDRRHIIEEAAGITKFKTKKKAAERKLEQTRQNLLRISDIVAELAKRLGSLRRQAQKAERYRKYKDEVKDIDLWAASHRFLELRSLEGTLSADYQQLQENLAQVRGDLELKDAEVLKERVDIGVEERRLTGLQEEIFELENRIRQSESQIEFHEREATQLESRCSSSTAEIARLKEQGEIERSELEEQNAALAELAAESTKESEGAADQEAELIAAKEALAKVQGELDSVRTNVAKSQADHARSFHSQESIADRAIDAKQRLCRVMEETEGMDKRIVEREKVSASLAEQLAKMAQIRLDLGNKEEEFSSRCEQLEGELSLCEAEVETLRTETHRRKSRLHSLREIHDKYEGFARGTRAVMQNSSGWTEGRDDFEIRGVVADVLTAPEQLEVAVEAALGDGLGGILVNKAEVGIRAIEYLKRTAAGRSAFVPFASPLAPKTGIQFEDRSGGGAMAEVPKGQGILGAMVDLVSVEEGYEDIANGLFGQVVVVDTLACAFALRDRGVANVLVTLDGDIVDARGVVAGGSRDSKGASVLAQKREIRELDQIVESLEENLREANARFVATKSELLKVTRAIEAIRNDRHDGELTMTAHEKDLAGAQADAHSLRERLARLHNEQLELEEKVREFEHEMNLMCELHSQAGLDMARYENEQRKLVDGFRESQEQVDRLGTLVTDARIRSAQIGEKKASLEASILRLEKGQNALSSRIDSLTTANTNDSERVVHLRAEREKISSALVDWVACRTKMTSELNESRTIYQRRHADIQEAETTVRNLRSQSETLAASCAAREVSVNKITSDFQHIEEGIEERYHVSLRSVVSEYHLRPRVTPDDEERLQQRRSLIDRMGTDINLTAIEEFRELSERHDFLSTQKQDLESALNQLEDAIHKINGASRKLFTEAFTLINEKFSRMFPKLFRGGRASLRLTGGDDVDILERGVEIHAQPPGKKNTTVDQFSGGEKALTAVALLFSIFLIKPSPFCLLDEVDAPLDEANVDRYNEILREMTDHSQFIVITHNKRTMAAADRLYGVTMAEPGVSKLVTVNLQKIGEKIKAA